MTRFNTSDRHFGNAGHFVVLFLLIGLVACASADAPPVPTATPPPPRPTILMMEPPLPTPLPLNAVPAAEECSTPSLAFGQHLAASGSYTETETAAAGPMICHIARQSAAFERLLAVENPAIIFKREESPPYHEEDSLVHPAMATPLSRLDELVQREWEGAVHLRVTDAYDSLLEHDLNQSDPARKYSLHFEGRSVDLTTWPINPARYGRLCALAHCAGFDWVHHEGDHCHASIRTESLCSATTTAARPEAGQ